MSILSFKIRKFKSDFPRGKWLEIFLMEKASPPLRNLVIFSKKYCLKIMISASKPYPMLNKQSVLILNMDLKVVYGFYLRSYEHFKFQNEEI